MRLLAPLLTALLLGPTAVAEHRLEFLMAGNAQDVDLDPASIGLGWLALHKSASGWALSPDQIGVERDGGVFELSGKLSDVLAFVRFDGALPGAIAAAPADSDGLVPHRFTFENSNFQLQIRSLGAAEADQPPRNSVVLASGEIESKLYGGENQSCSSPVILWAGDLDRDRRLDLIVLFGDDSDKNASICLFRSKGARPGELVAEGRCQFFSG